MQLSVRYILISLTLYKIKNFIRILLASILLILLRS